jgi:hypothetical protein
VQAGREGCGQAGECAGRQEHGHAGECERKQGIVGAGNGECASGGMEVQAGSVRAGRRV